MANLLILFSLFAFPFMGSADLIPTKLCSADGSAIVHNVKITPCPQAINNLPCVLKKGTTAAIEIDFTPTVTTSEVFAKASTFFLGRESTLPFMNRMACETLECPLTPSIRQTYRYDLFVAPLFPSRGFNVSWSLEGGPFNLCVQFPIEITK